MRTASGDQLPRALYSEYCNADVSWFDLPDRAKDQWRRVAAFVDRIAGGQALDLDPCQECHPELHRSQCWPNARCVATEETN